MNVTSLPLEGLKRIELKLFRDDRGFFNERFQQEKFREVGLPFSFVQDNHSRSKPSVLRGVHYQANPSQGKLVGVIRGRIYDVAVDIRSESPTYGKWYGAELSDENGRMLWIPAGFAHGFCVLGDEPADVLYKVDHLYVPSAEGGILWDDPEFGIEWPIAKPTLSKRDLEMQTFAQYKSKPVF